MEAKRYRKRPVEVEAMHYRDDSDAQAIAEWCGARSAHLTYEESDVTLEGTKLGHRVFEIETLEGDMTARPGDYIIRGVQGEFYPCKPEIFHATYEEA